MGKRKPISQPSPTELAILHVLWQRGKATVREVWEALREERSCGYTTVLKLMQIMDEKGLVKRDVSQWAHVYRAARSKDNTQMQLVRDLIDRGFKGSAQSLVLRALEASKVSPRELGQIRQALDEMEKEEEEGS